LRGKPLNVEKAREEKLMSNEEIRTIISAVGIDIGENCDLAKLRYAKIVILTDADVDGQHIRTLLLTFFYRQMPKLIEEKHVYVPGPPLFKGAQKKNVRYVQTSEEMGADLMRRGLDGTKLVIPPPSPGVATPGLLEGDKLAQLVRVLDDLEAVLLILERR